MARKRLSRLQKQEVEARAGRGCEYCRALMDYTSDDFAVEHIIPLDAGGTNELDNLALSCQGCNNRKFTAILVADPETQEKAALFHPRQHRWEEHFKWSEDSSEIVGVTPTGRVTVMRLKLNRIPLVNLRRALKTVGVHPPQTEDSGNG